MVHAGIFLESSDALQDPAFQKVILFITACNEQGSVGFVTNKPFGRNLNELEEFSSGLPLPLYEGGPVEQEKLYFIHRCPALIPGGTQVTDNVFVGGEFKQALEGLNRGEISSHDIRLFVGYCGWDAGQLEEEIEEGSWIVRSLGTSDIFTQ